MEEETIDLEIPGQKKTWDRNVDDVKVLNLNKEDSFDRDQKRHHETPNVQEEDAKLRK